MVSNDLGLHLRAATFLALKARQFLSHVEVEADGEIADGKSVVSLLMLGLGKGSQARLRVDGDDEETAARELGDLFEEGFGENV